METPRNDTHPEDTARPDATEGKWAVPAAVEAREDANADTAGIAQMAPGAQVARSRLSPLNARRLQSFKANRRGFWSFWIFLFLFFATLGAEFVANDKPLLVEYKGEYYAPIFVDYPEEVFGGFLPVTNYRDPFVQEEITANGWMVWPPIRYSYRTVNNEIPTPAPSAPSWTFTKEERCARYPRGVEDPNCVLGNANWLGTDDQARDVAARLIYGFRISVLFGLVLTGLSALIGVSAGAVQGYFGGWIDLLFQRFIEIWSSIPVLYLLLIIAAILPPGFWILLGIMLLFSWVAFVGVVRAEFLRARNFEYVNAARALGVGDWTIMVRHLLPNAMVATLTFLPFILNGSITTLTSLDFLGFGLPPGSPSLGELLAQGKNNLQAPWLGISGFVVLSLMLSLLVFVGEAVRDAFDPRKSFR
jgi:microcin C transport system permease protein